MKKPRSPAEEHILRQLERTDITEAQRDVYLTRLFRLEFKALNVDNTKAATRKFLTKKKYVPEATRKIYGDPPLEEPPVPIGKIVNDFLDKLEKEKQEPVTEEIHPIATDD
jgi:hypothetical protein